MTLGKKRKPAQEKWTEVEIDEHVSIDKNAIPQYPRKACITFNNNFYYIFYLYEKLVVERVSFDEVRV